VTHLLDSNVLIALAIEDHVHHQAAEDWFASTDDGFATCPITQGALLRQALRSGDTIGEAQKSLALVVAHPRHEFWPDEVGYGDVVMHGIRGHRQVTDAYLAQLARCRSGRLVTFDRGLAALHPDVTVVVPTRPQLPEQRTPE
jgi:toxin-antitoxin system PIN domain toxin